MEMANVVDEITWWSVVVSMGEDSGVSTAVCGVHASDRDNGCSVLPNSSDDCLGDHCRILSCVARAYDSAETKISR